MSGDGADTERGHGEAESKNVERNRTNSAGDRGKSILCKPAVQPLALRYSAQLHKGDEGGGVGSSGVSVGDRPRLEVWQ